MADNENNNSKMSATMVRRIHISLGRRRKNKLNVEPANEVTVYKTYEDLIADTNPKTRFAFVKDASSDPKVTFGPSTYEYKDGSWTTLRDEQTGGGESTPTPVPESHTHDNKSILDKLSYNSEKDDLLFNGTKIITENEALTKYLQLVRCVETENPVQLKLEFYTDAAMTDKIGEMDSDVATDAEKMMYFNGDNFVAVATTGIPAIAAGRFVLIDIEDVITVKHMFIKWIWTDKTTSTRIWAGGCSYPSITPTSNESVGLVWRQINS